MDADTKYWRSVAFYLADCHAATAEVFNDRKSASKSDVRRFRNISNTCRQLLSGEAVDIRLSMYQSGSRTDCAVIDRCAAGADAATDRKSTPYKLTDADLEVL